MAMWRAGYRNVYELNAWQKADAFSTLLEDVCRELDLGRAVEVCVSRFASQPACLRAQLLERVFGAASGRLPLAIRYGPLQPT